MAGGDRESSARASGDVVRGALVPMTGALLGAALGTAASASTTASALRALLRDSLSGGRAPVALLETVPGLLLTAVGPTLLGAFAGATVLGFLQTRGALGPLREPQGVEARAPNPIVALLGWIALGVVALDALRLALGLHPGARPLAIGGAAVEVTTHMLRAGLLALAVIALADHLLRARARRIRLGLDEPQAPRRTAFAAPVADERLDALVAGAQLVLYDDDRAIALSRHDGAWVINARARGLSGIALREAARRRALPLRAAPALELLDPLMLGVPLLATQAARVGLREEAA